MKTKQITAFCLCAVALLSGVISGCSKNSETEISESVSAVLQSEPETASSKAETETVAVLESQEQTEVKESDDTVDTPSYEPPVSADPATCVITVDNKDRKVNVGDVVTYTCYLKTPDKIEDIQAKIIYTGASLKLMDTDVEKLFPVLGDITICNTEAPGLIKFNAVKIKGIDFTEKDVLVTLRFKVTTGVSASIATTVEFLTEKGGKSYIENCKAEKDVDVIIEETLK